MNDVGAHGDMDGDRNAELGTGGQNARGPVRKPSFRAVYVTAHRFAQTLTVAMAFCDRFIEEAAGIFRHAESSVIDLVVDFLGRMAHEGELKVMNDAGTVHGHRSHESLLHPADQNGREPDFDHVSADA